MTSPICEDEGIIQEWCPEYRLLSQIPIRAQKGIFSQELKLTCVDACFEFITLGTNCGLVYWYNRDSAELQRLRLEYTNCSVTCVKIVSTVDFMVAAGTDVGNITVFQIPKQPPDSLPAAFRPKGKQVERFTIDGLHKNPVSCLEWSKNGMKLFSGDKTGAVVLTTIDFQSHLSKSTDLLNEQYEIVQLSYLQNQLLISTTYRTILCNGNENWRVTQLGSKERKILGRFGATFCKFGHGAVIYASRPGQRLWLADTAGNVEQTLIFKAAMQAPHASIPLLNPTTKQRATDQNFGRLAQFGDSLVCYQSDVLHILHPGAITVIASLANVRKIIDVAVCSNEIFVLEGDRSLIRLGHEPNLRAMDEIEEKEEKRKSFNFDELANKIKTTAVGSLKRMTSDLIASGEKISPPTMGDEALDLSPVDNARSEEAGAIVPNVEIHEHIEEEPALASSIRSPPAPKAPGPEEEVLFRPVRRKKPKKIYQNLQPGATPGSESDTMSVASDDRLVCGVANDLSVSEDSPTSWSQSSFSLLRDLHSSADPSQHAPGVSKTPDDKSQASIDTCDSASENLALTPNFFKEEQENIFRRLTNNVENSMLDSFNSEMTENMSISVNLTPSSSASSKLSEHTSSKRSDEMSSENVSMISECEPRAEVSEPVAGQPPSQETSSMSSGNSQNAPGEAGSSRQWNKDYIISQMLGLDLRDPASDIQKHDEDKQEENDAQIVPPPAPDDCPTPLAESLELEENNSLLPESEQALCPRTPEKLHSLGSLNYGPPSGSSMLSSCHPSLDLNSGPAVLSNPQALVVEKSDRWLQYKMPEGVTSLAVCKNYVMCCDAQDRVFYSQLSGISLSWAPLDYLASGFSVSLDARLVWLQHKKSVTALVRPASNGPFSEEVVEAARNVLSFAVDTDCAYIVRVDGRIMCQKNLTRYPCGQSELVPCSWLVKKILCRNGVVLALTNDDSLICRKTSGKEFSAVSTPSKAIMSMALGPGNIVWVVDADNNIYFADHFDDDFIQTNWWQVLISEYIFQNSPSTFLNMHNRMKMGARWEIGRYGSQTKETLIAANDQSVWVYNKSASTVYVNKCDFTGILWQDISYRFVVKFVGISANGVFEKKGHIWLRSVQGDIFCAAAHSPGNISAIAGPCDSEIVCMAPALDTLWILTGEGTVYARIGLSDTCVMGSSWRQLRLPQLTDQRLIWVSCGCDVAWCVDIAGRIFITLVPPHDMATNVFDAAWLEVEGKPKDNASFVKVFVGPHMHMVWALDSKKQIYVREGIFPHYQIGTSWVHVGGIEATQLTVSSTAVWAVSPSGAVFRRHGISENNYIGDYWRRVPGLVLDASATFNDELWGIMAGEGVARMLQKRISLEKNEERRAVSIGEGDDWLVVE